MRHSANRFAAAAAAGSPAVVAARAMMMTKIITPISEAGRTRAS